jgi:Rrf2 family protein
MELARHWQKKPLNISDISKNQDISVKYLEQLIRPLKKAGLVESIRGAQGGHLLVKKPEEITLGCIVRLLEDPPDLTVCIGKPETCAVSDECNVRQAWESATKALYRQLDSISIADLIG